MANPPGPCTDQVLGHGFDGTATVVCPRTKAVLDCFGRVATSFGTLTAVVDQPFIWNIRSNDSAAAPISYQFAGSPFSVFKEANGSSDQRLGRRQFFQ